MEIKQNTLYLTTPNSYVARDHLNLKIEVERELKLAVPIHHLESVCVFGQVAFSPAALQLCWENGVAVNYFSEKRYLLGRGGSGPNKSVGVRRGQYRAAGDTGKSAGDGRASVPRKPPDSRPSPLPPAKRTRREAEN